MILTDVSRLLSSFRSVIHFLYSFVYISNLFLILPSIAQNQRVAIVASGLEKFESLSIINLAHPDPKKAISADIVQLGRAPNDVQTSGYLAYVVNTFSHNVQIINFKNGTNVGEISTGVGSEPEKIALLNDDRAYVTCAGNNEVILLDLKNKSLLQRIRTGSKPWGLTILNKKVYVANSAAVWNGKEMKYGQSSVSVISTETNQLIKTIKVPTNATEVTSDGTNTILVISTGNYVDILGKLTLIDSKKDNIKKQIDLKSTPGVVAVNRSQQQAYILSPNGAIVVDLVKQRLTVKPASALPNFKGGFGLAFDNQRLQFLVAVPDWSGGGQDKLLILDSQGKEINRYAISTEKGKGASFVIWADMDVDKEISVRPNPKQSIISWGQLKQY